MEEKLYQWIVGQQKTSGELLTRFEIKKKAKEMSSVDTFKASKGWLDKFKKRFGIIVRPSALESEGIESTGLAHTSSNLNDRKLSNVRGDAALEHNIENSIQFEKEIPSKLDSEEIHLESNKTHKAKQDSKIMDIHDFLDFSEDQS